MNQLNTVDPVITNTSTALTLPERAQIALGSAAYEIALRELVQN
jgi:hypothetical protein